MVACMTHDGVFLGSGGRARESGREIPRGFGAALVEREVDMEEVVGGTDG